jgi:hypothetical protein
MEGEDRFLVICLRLAQSIFIAQEWRLMIGFDMATMNSTYFDEGQIDLNEAKEIVTNEFIIKVCIV